MLRLCLLATLAPSSEPADDPPVADTQTLKQSVAAPAPLPPSPAPPAPSQLDVERLERLENRLKRVERENRALREEVELLREDKDEVSTRVDRIMPLTGRIGGYVDFGFFHAMGDGSGVRTDIGHIHYPEYRGVVPDSWVFMGDPLSTTINSRGEPANAGESRAITFDGVDSRGKSSFILNAFNLNVFAGLGRQVSMEGLVDFVPRSRNVSDPDPSRFAL